MSICTAAEAVNAMLYYEGYYEKATSAYAQSRDKSYFDKNKGSNNFTYAGYMCGVQGQPWCAAQDTTAILDACGGIKADAKKVLWGVYPYTVCNQVWEAAPSNVKIWSYHQRFVKGKGDRVDRNPVPGDIIVFTDDGVTRSHTGMVYAVGNGYIYTIEGNSGNMCRKRSYDRKSSYIYGWIHPNYKASSDKVVTTIEQYGPVCCNDPVLHILSKGCAGPEVKTVQRIIYARAIDRTMSVDGSFGPATKAGVIAMQKILGIEQDGIVGSITWKKMLASLN